MPGAHSIYHRVARTGAFANGCAAAATLRPQSAAGSARQGRQRSVRLFRARSAGNSPQEDANFRRCITGSCCALARETSVAALQVAAPSCVCVSQVHKLHASSAQRARVIDVAASLVVADRFCPLQSRQAAEARQQVASARACAAASARFADTTMA